MCVHSLIFGVAGLYLSPWDRHYFNTTWDPTCATQDTLHNKTKQRRACYVTIQSTFCRRRWEQHYLHMTWNTTVRPRKSAHSSCSRCPVQPEACVRFACTAALRRARAAHASRGPAGSRAVAGLLSPRFESLGRVAADRACTNAGARPSAGAATTTSIRTCLSTSPHITVRPAAARRLSPLLGLCRRPA